MTAKEYPDTLEEMAPLYAAVAHGCRAGHYHEAYRVVYFDRIRRKNEYFPVSRLGALGAQLAAISNFFVSPSRKPVAGLTDLDRSVVLLIRT